MKKGFTLIEIMVYVAIIGLVVFAFINFSLAVASAGNKAYVEQEVQANARLALDILRQRIMSAKDIELYPNSIFDLDPGTLSLTMADGAVNPTIFSLTGDDGTLQIKEGASSAVPITTSKVKITNLVFTNLTPPNNKRKNVKIDLTVEYDSAGSGVAYSYSQSFSTAVSLRQ
jgi:prepilin-type N-terminal cleavage/methylation domain-containing protein